jgi:asparagine synthase (glutamine-hydrolysing)
MCGIAGFLNGNSTLSEARDIVTTMADAMVHRGPDDAGVWVDERARIALGHRRLSIVDLSPAGHQPMQSASERYVIAFNGEIYNWRTLRVQLERAGTPCWRGNSDTEVLLGAIDHWGLEATLLRCTGMFAFALWDKQEQLLYLVRDRLGEKPLYYGWLGDTFLFGSELKALRSHPKWMGRIDRGALALLLRHNYVPSPYSIYESIYKLPPGTYLSVTRNERDQSLKCYWSARAICEGGAAVPLKASEQDLTAVLDDLLRESIAQQMVADVPLGAFLSGGVDSTTVVALMQAQSSRPVRTFTIGFHEDGYNEAHHAKAIAQHLGTDHTELYVTPNEAMSVIPRLPALYDEPFADSSQIPTLLVAQLAKKHVTVSLSGDGGDELFGGYNRYFLGRKLWNGTRHLPLPVREALARSLYSLAPDSWDRCFGMVGRALPASLRYANIGDKAHKLAEVLTARDADAIYYGLISHWKNPSNVVIASAEPATALSDPNERAALPDFTLRMMYQDLVTYLPDDILVKVDRAAMGVSLETRVPLLDHHVVEFAWRVPLSMKIRGGQGKWLLRQVLYKYVPKKLIERPKMGFGVPIGHWLRGPLRGWAEDLLSQPRLAREGYFHPHAIREKWDEHLSGRRNWQYYLWDVLMFQAWLESNR